MTQASSSCVHIQVNASKRQTFTVLSTCLSRPLLFTDTPFLSLMVRRRVSACFRCVLFHGGTALGHSQEVMQGGQGSPLPQKQTSTWKLSPSLDIGLPGPLCHCGNFTEASWAGYFLWLLLLLSCLVVVFIRDNFIDFFFEQSYLVLP